MEDVKNLMGKASRSMGVIKFVWDAREVSLKITIKFHSLTLLNLLLWGGENWSGNQEDIANFEAFQNKAIRTTLCMSIMQVKDEEIMNAEVTT